MANYDENNKGTLSREHFRKKLAGLTFPLTFNSKRKSILSAIYTIRAEEPNSVIVSASTATREYRFLVKNLNNESYTDPEAYPNSDVEGRYFPKGEFELTAAIDHIKVRTVIKNYTQKPEDSFNLTAAVKSIVLTEYVIPIHVYAQPLEDDFALTASVISAKIRTVVINHNQPLEDTFSLTSKIEQIRRLNLFNNYVDSTERYANSSSVTIDVPSATKVGDVLIAVLVTSSNTNVTSPDWINEFSASPNNTVRIFTRVWDGEATSYTFTLGTTVKWTVYCYIAEEYVTYDYTVQNTRSYIPSTGNELRIIGYDDGFDNTTYAGNDISLVAPEGGIRTGYPKYLANNTTKTLELAGTVTKLPITSLDPIALEIDFPNPNITKQFMVILETRRVNLLNPPTNVTAEFVDPRAGS